MFLCFITSHTFSQTTLLSTNFDDNPIGWTSGAWGLNGDSDNQSSWEMEEPNGGQGYNDIRNQRSYVGNPDPSVDYTSSNTVNFVFGQGLESSNRREGRSGHFNNSSEWLQTPVINCANYYNVTLDYYRWANFEPGYDFAFIEVSTDGTNWDVAYNPTNLEDNGWNKHTLDISKWADRQSTVYVRWRSESDGSVFYAGWNIDDVNISGTYNTNDYTSSIATGAVTVPLKISSLTDTYAEKVAFGEFSITDAGSGDNLPTIIDSLVITPGVNNEITDWKKAITNIYLYEASSGQEIEGLVTANSIYFSNSSLLTIPDGTSRTYQLSFYVEADLTGIQDNDQFEFALDFGSQILNSFGSLISSGELSTGINRLVLDIEASQLTFLVEPQQLIAPNRDLLPTVQVAATDENGNIDFDYSGSISLNNSGGLSMLGTTVNTINGLASFVSCQFTEEGGPVTLSTSHTGSSLISNATTAVSITILNSLSNAIFFDNFDNTSISGWTSGSISGTSSWELGDPNGGSGYDDQSRRYIGNADPTRDYTSSNTIDNVWGQGLSRSNRREGVSGHYNSSDEWLMSPAIDLTSYYNTQLRFYRWANFEPYYDTAFVEASTDGINWIDLNHTLFPSDNGWTAVYLDISEVADRQPRVYIRWRSSSDASIFYAGWNIDDVEINGIFSPVTDWIGTVSANWNEPLNWKSGFVPDKLSNVYIDATAPYQPIISGTAECNEIIIKKNASLEIEISGDLTVFGDVQIETDNSNYGALVDRGSLAILGNGIVSRYLSGDRWHYVSSPISHSNTIQFGEEIYYYDPSLAGEDWRNGWILAENISLDICRGYDVFKHKNDIVSLEGAFNSGNYGINLSNLNGSEDDDREGWNLVGNPYPSAIDWDAATGWTKTNINDAIYIWDETQQNFVAYVNDVGVNGGSRYIPPMQGFFVKVHTPGSGYLGMTNEVRTVNTDSKFKSAGNNSSGLSISITNSIYSDETIVRLIEGAGYNFERKYDAYKRFSTNSNVPQISTLTGKGEQLAINSYSDETAYAIIPIHINVPRKRTNYVLNFDGVWNINPSKTVYLEDTELDSLIDLYKTFTYSFEAQNLIDTGRFILHIGKPLELKASLKHASEHGVADGFADITIYGGVQPIKSVVWSNGSVSEDISELIAGEYIVRIIDGADNILVDTLIIENINTGDEEETIIKAIDIIEENELKIYTDHHQLVIQPTNSNTISDILIHDMSGKLIYSNTKSFNDEVIINLDHLLGIYLVSANYMGVSLTQKILLK